MLEINSKLIVTQSFKNFSQDLLIFQIIMRIRVEVDVVNRSLASRGMKSNSKKAKSVLAIGRKSLSDTNSEIVLLLSNNSNKSGTKYHIKNNIDNIFVRMVSEGKCTIRFREPPHDLCIKCDEVSMLKGFLMIVKKTMDGKLSDDMRLSAIQPVSSKDIEGPKKKLTILKRSDYPLQGFPHTLQQLQVSEVRLAKADKRILRLGNLTCLSLSDNEISTLPDNWESMGSLADLNLSGNQLENLPRQFCVGNLAKSLKSLNLSRNKIILLPNFLCNLKQLITLDLSKNNMKCLPPSLGKLTNMRHFLASDNNLTNLPGSFSRLR